jgi:hypothetical protein
MTLKFKTTYLEAIRSRYFAGSKKRKSEILNELCKVTGYSRKHAIRVLSIGHMTSKKNSGRTRAYSNESIIHLKRIWHIMGRICSKKMVSALPIWLKFYQGPEFTPLVKEELISMSSSTIDRYLKDYKKQFARRKRTGTRRSKTFQNVIPIKNFDHFASKPGYIQADTVAHCGNSLSGVFIWTMTVTDEFTGWTENRTMYGKGALAAHDAICTALYAVPFRAISFNTDNGTEFINKILYKLISQDRNIAFTRSRPYKSNDNAHVEQKNFTHVRELFGYDRLEFEDLVEEMDKIYRFHFNVLHNFFIPQQKLISKSRIGSKYVKVYDKPKTPYQRVMESPDISRKRKEDLRKIYEKLNPIELKRELNQKMKEFHKYHEKLKAKKKALVEYYEYYGPKDKVKKAS